MQQLIKMNNNNICVFLGTNKQKAIENGFYYADVVQALDGKWYFADQAPTCPQKTYIEKRLAEYPSIQDQLDMIYWDKVNGTNLWQEKITEIKTKYPKE